MKRKILILLVVICLGGCSSLNEEKKKNTTKKDKEVVETNTCKAEIGDHDIILGGTNNNITVETEKYEENMDVERSITINYPIISGLDVAIDSKVNEMIKNEAFVIKTESIVDTDNTSFELDYEWHASKDVLSIKFEGLIFTKGMPHPNNYMSTLNINLKNGDRLKFSDLYNVNKNMEGCLYDKGEREELRGMGYFGREEFSLYLTDSILEILKNSDTTSYLGSGKSPTPMYTYYADTYLLIIIYHGIPATGQYNQMIVPYEDIEKLRLN